MRIKEVVSPRIETEVILEQKIDTSIFRKKGNSKTFKGFLIQKIKEARKRENPEMVQLLGFIYNKFNEFEKTERFNPKQWKGKSGVSYIEEPDKVICVRFQKQEPYEQAKEIRVEILRGEINNVLASIHILNSGKWIKTRDIAELTYQKKWKEVFSDRPVHIKLTEIFNYLEHRGIIDYKRSGKVFLK